MKRAVPHAGHLVRGIEINRERMACQLFFRNFLTFSSTARSVNLKGLATEIFQPEPLNP